MTWAEFFQLDTHIYQKLLSLLLSVGWWMGSRYVPCPLLLKGNVHPDKGSYQHVGSDEIRFSQRHLLGDVLVSSAF